MVEKVSQQTLQNISNPIQGGSVLSGYMKGLSLREEKESNALKKTMLSQQMEINDLTLESKRQQGLGSAAFGVLDMLDRASSPMEAASMYETYRNNAPDGVREELPRDFRDVQELQNWARQTAAQADKLVPWMQLKATKAEASQWQFKVSLAAIPPEDRTKAQQRQLDSMISKGINIWQGNPTGSKLDDTVMTLSGSTAPGTDQSILDSLDSKSKAAYISAVSNLADVIVASARKDNKMMDRSTAMAMAERQLRERVVPVATLKERLPFIGDMFDKDFVFLSPEALKDIQSEQDKIDTTTVGEEVQIGDWIYDSKTKKPIRRAE